jgi:MFS family permease
MLVDLSPLRHRDFRLVFAGQFVSALGTFLTYVALPVELYALTRSSVVVGLLGTVQLVCLAATALWGGALADAVDRRRLLLWCEGLLLCGSAGLAALSSLPHPSVALLFVVAGLMSAASGFQTPTLESLSPRLVEPGDLTAVSALTALRGSIAMVGGPALAGVCIAALGVPATFALDAATYAVSFAAVAAIRAMPPGDEARPAGLASILEGIRYAASRGELVGTYVVDFVALAFAMPMALFPALAAGWGGASAVGWLYSAMSVGGLVMSLFSGWTKKVRRHGAAVVIAAAAFGASIAALGFARSLPAAFACLALAGAADMVSGLFRMTIWNETIPPELRGRTAGIEQIAYMSGPLIGNARAGLAADRFGLARSIVGGGIAAVVGVCACAPLLPAFWRYLKKDGSPTERREER